MDKIQGSNVHSIDWNAEEYKNAVDETCVILAEYIQESRQGAVPAAQLQSMQNNQSLLKAENLLKNGGLAHGGLSEFLKTYLKYSTRLHHPAYMGHQVATPAIPSALADLVHGSINNPMAMYEMGPTAASLEHQCLNWMLEKIGWQPEPLDQPMQKNDAVADIHGAGVFVHGGSLANLVALIAARSVIAPQAWEEGNPSDLYVLAPENSHYSVVRALSIMGLGRNAMVGIAVDEFERIIPEQLEEKIHAVKSDGKRIMAVVANSCTTGTGLFDPLKRIADICQKNDLWLHVDACHGGSHLISEKYKQQLDGAHLASSFVWDAHKMMRVSGLCTAVLVRNSEHLQHAFQQQASYLFYGSPSMGKDFIHRTVECTKSPMATKLFMTLAWKGEQAVAHYVEGRIEAALEFYHLIRQRDKFDCPYIPESNILCFRYGEDCDLQIEIREKLLKQGSFHLTSAEVSGKRYLRFTVMSPDTDASTITELLDAIEQQWPI